MTGDDASTAARGRLAHVDYTYPDDRWAGWSPGGGIARLALEIAEELAEPGPARATTARAVEIVNADSLRKGGIVAQNAIWVPRRSTGEVAGILDVTIIAAPGGPSAPERHLSRSLRRDFGWTTRILEYAAQTSEVPAGRMTIEQVLLRRFGEREVQAYLFLNVYPPVAQEAASLVLNTVHLDLLGDLARHGRMIAESLRLTLGDIPGGRSAP